MYRMSYVLFSAHAYVHVYERLIVVESMKPEKYQAKEVKQVTAIECEREQGRNRARLARQRELDLLHSFPTSRRGEQCV